MSGTKEGGKKAARTIFLRHGKDFYREIGREGGRNGHTGGFASLERGKDGLTGAERARKVGKIGGKRSRRGPAYLYKNHQTNRRKEISGIRISYRKNKRLSAFGLFYESS